MSNAVGFGEVGGLHLVATLEQDEPPSTPARMDEAGRREELAAPEEGRGGRRSRAREKAEAATERLKDRVAKAESQLAAERDALREAEAAARGATLEARRAATALERAERRSR